MDRKIMTWILIVLVLAFFIFMNRNQSVMSNVIAQDVENLHQVDLAIENMYCEACAYGVGAQIEDLEGVISADIDYKSASGVIQYDADKVDVDTIVAASTVYPASVISDNKIQ